MNLLIMLKKRSIDILGKETNIFMIIPKELETKYGAGKLWHPLSKKVKIAKIQDGDNNVIFNTWIISKYSLCSLKS